MKCQHWYWWCFIAIRYFSQAQDPTVTLRQGRVVGTRIFMQNSPFPIETFFGIPYAIAPIGRHRFSAPERHPGWRRTLYAHRLPPRCPQLGDSDHDVNFNEDCLYLNICTPRRAEVKLLPVVVLLYSKSWSNKGTLTLPCQELSSEGLVVVSVAYRLHLLGFFSLRSRIARGNLAILDQYMAFMWIRENIAEFGGDPGTVTVLGHSAGTDSILYHLASPRTAGLFHRAILMSPRRLWRAVENINDTDAQVERSSREACMILDCPTTETEETIMKCMQAKSFDDIIRLYSRTNWSGHMEPVIENFLPQSEQYLPFDLPRGLSAPTESKIDILFGTTDLDAIDHEDADYKELISIEPNLIFDYISHQVIPELLRRHDLQNSEVLSTLVENVLWEYWGPQALRIQSNMHEIVENLGRAKSSARWGAGAALLAAKLARRASRLYVYWYTQPGQVDLQGNQINFTGAVYGTDLISLLGDGMLEQLARRRPNNYEQRMSAYIRSYWVNFIKFGSPTTDEEWSQYRAGAAYLRDLNIVDNRPNSKRPSTASREVAFWLQYLPFINSLHSSKERTETLNLAKEDTRLRGAIYALVGVAVVLLVLLCIGTALLRRGRQRQADFGMD